MSLHTQTNNTRGKKKRRIFTHKFCHRSKQNYLDKYITKNLHTHKKKYFFLRRINKDLILINR